MLEDGGELTASAATGALDDQGTVELKRLYVAGRARRRGLGTALVRLVEAHAAGLGAHTVELWSDTRFADAHRLYRSLGYRATQERRELHDPSHTTEQRFVRDVAPAPPQRSVTWHGPHGEDRCDLVELPDGAVLAGTVGDVRYRVEVDGAWRTRSAQVVEPAGRHCLHADAHGRWWSDGTQRPELGGCLDVDIEVTPATNTLPIRRLGSAADHQVELSAAWMRIPGGTVTAVEQRYQRITPTRWVYGGDGGDELEVDELGLVVRYGTLWSR